MPTFYRGAMWRGVLILVTLAACQMGPMPPTVTAPSPIATVASEASPSIPTTEDAVPRITVGELKTKLDAGKDVVIVDTRSVENFNEKRIAGAVSMPLVEVDLRYQELPKDKEIVLYCT